MALRWENEKGRVGADFDYNATTSAEMAEWNVRLDLTHQICPSASSEDVLIVDGGLSKEGEIGPNFCPASSTKTAMVKQMAALDSDIKMVYTRGRKAF